MNSLPILYTFRRCPYAIRARLAIKTSGIPVELREVALASKPDEMLRASPKATVPILVLTDGSVIDESRDIMLWALKQNDPENWLKLTLDKQREADALVAINDGEFKTYLDYYKYSDRFPEKPIEYYREQAEFFLLQLEELLIKNTYIFGDTISYIDIAIFPFVRQFAYVDIAWFEQSNYLKLQLWLSNLLSSKLFLNVMNKYPIWKMGDSPVIFK